MFIFIKSFFISNYSVIISTISFLLSFFVFLSNRKTLSVTIEDSTELIDTIYLYEDTPYMTLENAHVCFIKVVNPSPHNISFFDLNVYDNKTLNPLTFLNEIVLKLNSNSEKHTIFLKKGDAWGKLYIPEATSGIFKSNSFTRLDIPVFLDDSTTEITLTFKVAIRRLFPSKKFNKRRRFKYYKKTIKIFTGNNH